MMIGLHQIILCKLEKIFSACNKIMTINDQIRDEKLPYDIKRKAAEISEPYHQVKLISILLVKKYYDLIIHK